MDGMRNAWLDFLPWRRWRVVATVEAADQIPAELPLHGAVVVGTIGKPKWVAFDCPCGRKHRIMVSLDPRHRPHWRLIPSPNLTLLPSIDAVNQGRRCHYFMRNGRAEWVRGRG